MSKTKFRSLGMGFLLAALILALVTVIWPFVPQSLKSQLDAVNLPIVSEGANEASYKAAYESLLAEKESGSQASTSSAKATSQASTTEAATTQSSKPVSITVEEGESSNDVADKLEKAGLVKSAKEFVDYLTSKTLLIRSGLVLSKLNQEALMKKSLVQSERYNNKHESVLQSRGCNTFFVYH